MAGKRKKKSEKKQQQQHGQAKGGKKAQTDLEQESEMVVLKKRPGKSHPIPGLSNLGNTCFFNSVMQNLGQSHYFRAELSQLLAKPSYTMAIKIQGRQDSSCRQLSVNDNVGQLTEKLSSFLTEMQTGGRVLNPRPVFSEICKKAPRFSGYHQQDSQELLRCLLDALRSEEITRIKRAILASYKITSDQKKNDKKEQMDKLTDLDRADIRAYGLQAHLGQTFVDNAFGGVLASTVVCKECKNKSTMHETFLDLSLPIGEDKSMISAFSLGGYQSRQKAKRKEEPGQIPAPKPQPELSKHQLKKREKQARKAARTASKKNLHKLSGESQDMEGTHPAEAQDTTVVDEALKDNATTNEIPFQNNLNKEDPPSELTMDNKAVDPNSSIDGTKGEGTTLDGPSNTVENSKGADELIHVVSESDPPHLPETENTEIQADQEGPVSNPRAPPPDQASFVESLTSGFESLKVEPNSLEDSLKKFCTPELLTGSNQFACVVCTKLKFENESNVPDTTSPPDKVASNLQQNEPVESTTEGGSSNTNDIAAPVSQETKLVDENPQSEHHNDGVITDDKDNNMTTASDDSATCIMKDAVRQENSEPKEHAGSQLGDNESKGSNQADSDDEKSVHDKDDSLEIGAEVDNEESSEEEPPKLKPKTSTTVFCDATKQMLVEKSPLILTLHLKRFLQRGRRLQKNSKYISFPPLLNMGPYCTETDQESPSPLLYSLYGIVEHSGGMQGGHYVAYVKQHTPPKVDRPGTTKEVSKDKNSADQCESPPTAVLKDESTESSSAITAESTNHTPQLSDEEQSKGACVIDPICTSNVDLSSTKGQWYYISDSQVRTTTQSEVLRSQAYLLFYEKLPLI